MKKYFSFFASMIMILSLISISCNTQLEEVDEPAKIENTLKSVSFWQDSLNIDPASLQAYLERINKVIDSIGYPDAGYQLWLIQSDSAADYRFLLNGNWPNQDVYNEIHEDELFLNTRDLENELFSKLNNTSYDRFTKIK